MQINSLKWEVQCVTNLSHNSSVTSIRGYFPIYSAFSITFEIVGKILHTENVGDLVDKLNKRNENNIDALDWKSFEVDHRLFSKKILRLT